MKTDEGTRLDLAINVAVFGQDERCGKSVALVLNPVTEKVTDIAVKLGGLSSREVMVPVVHISRSSNDGIWLDIPCSRVTSMPDFKRTEYIQADIPREFTPGALMVWPFVTSETDQIPVEIESIPLDELAIHAGSDVISMEGKVGKVDEFLIDPQDDRISHLVMREGHLWGKNDVLIPVSAVSSIEEHAVKVELDKQQIEALPELPVHRSARWFSTS